MWNGFVRIRCSGLYPRRFGPFYSEEQAKLFLDEAAGTLWEALQEAGTCDIANAVYQRMVV